MFQCAAERRMGSIVAAGSFSKKVSTTGFEISGFSRDPVRQPCDRDRAARVR